MPDVAYRDEMAERDYSVLSIGMIRSDVNVTRRDVDALKGGMADIKRDVRTLKGDVDGLNKDVAVLKQDVSTLKQDVAVLKDDVSELKGNVKVLGVRMDGLDKRIDDLSQSQNKWFMLLGLLVAVVPVVVALIQGMIAR